MGMRQFPYRKITGTESAPNKISLMLVPLPSIVKLLEHWVLILSLEYLHSNELLPACDIYNVYSFYFTVSKPNLKAYRHLLEYE